MSGISIGISVGGRLARNAKQASVLAAEAAGRWTPESLVESAGKVEQWTNLGTGGTNYDLIKVSDATRPTYNATANRSGGPACVLVRATPTRLATVAFALSQPNTQIWVAKTTSATNNQRLSDGRTGNTRSLFQLTNVTFLQCGATQVSGTTNNVVAGTWYGWAGVANGASSILRVGADVQTGNADTAAASGIVLGDFGLTLGAAWDGTVERGYFWTRALTAAEIAAVFGSLGL